MKVRKKKRIIYSESEHRKECLSKLAKVIDSDNLEGFLVYVSDKNKIRFALTDNSLVKDICGGIDCIFEMIKFIKDPEHREFIYNYFKDRLLEENNAKDNSLVV